MDTAQFYAIEKLLHKIELTLFFCACCLFIIAVESVLIVALLTN